MKPNEQSSRAPSLLCRWYASQKATRLAVEMAEFRPDETGHTAMPLSRMRPGEFGHVLTLQPGCEVREHLLELGFTPGTEITVIRVAPLGDPLTVRIRGYQLSLRRREAEVITMRRCPPDFDLYADGPAAGQTLDQDGE
jgi:ferrous iron transport protein A